MSTVKKILWRTLGLISALLALMVPTALIFSGLLWLGVHPVVSFTLMCAWPCLCLAAFITILERES